MITHVAIRHPDGRIFSLPRPYRHHHIIRVMVDALEIEPPIRGRQGFLDNRGNFLSRKAAADLALKTGQCVKLDSPPRLFSEDLW